MKGGILFLYHNKKSKGGGPLFSWVGELLSSCVLYIYSHKVSEYASPVWQYEIPLWNTRTCLYLL